MDPKGKRYFEDETEYVHVKAHLRKKNGRRPQDNTAFMPFTCLALGVVYMIYLYWIYIFISIVSLMLLCMVLPPIRRRIIRYLTRPFKRHHK